MKSNNVKLIRMVILWQVLVSVSFSVGQYALAQDVSVEMHTKAETMIRESLSRVQNRYRERLSYYGWTELYYGETRGICNLQLDMPGRAASLAILYVRADNTIQYPQIMPKGLAEQLIGDRMLIEAYRKSLNGSKSSSRPIESADRKPKKKGRAEYKPLHDEGPYKPDKEEQAAFAKSKKLVEEQKKYYENQKRDSRRRR